MAFVEQAYGGKNNWWRWLIVSTIILLPFLYKTYLFSLNYSKPFKQLDKNTNSSIALIFSWYILFFTLLVLLLRFVHKRKLRSLITYTSSIDWWRIIFGISLGGLFIIFFFSINYFINPSSFKWNFKLQPFLELVVICITLAPLGAAFKEVFFNGYLLQGFSIWLKRKWLALIVVSILYTLIFGFNPIIKNVGFEILLFYFTSTLLTGLITLLDERLELAIGVRIANTVFRLLYITTLWYPVRSNALLLDHSKPNVLYLVYIPIFIFFPTFLFCLKEMYKWKDCKERIFKKLY